MVQDPNVVLSAYDLGINFFFISSDLHWTAYSGLREGLGRLLDSGHASRSEIVVALVSYMTQPEFLAPAFEEGLDAISSVIDSADVLIAGGCYAQDFTIRLAVLQEMRLRRYLGVSGIGMSFHDRVASRVAINSDELDLALIRYNALHPGARNDLFPFLEPDYYSTLVFNFNSTQGHTNETESAPIRKSASVPHITDHYRFVVSRPEIDGILFSPQSAKELREVRSALEKGGLEPDEEDDLIKHCQGVSKLYKGTDG